jgi:hypothetical protein
LADTQRDMRLQKPQHVRRLLTEIINEIRHDTAMDKERQARVLGYLSNITSVSHQFRHNPTSGGFILGTLGNCAYALIDHNGAGVLLSRKIPRV